MYVDGYDLSGDARNVGSADLTYNEADMTAFANSTKNYLAGGTLQAGIKGFQALMNDDGGASSALNAAAASVVSLAFGSETEPVITDTVYMMSSVQLSGNASFDSMAGVLSADFVSKAVSNWPCGIVLKAKATISTTSSGAAANNGAATLNGWHANLHITTGAGVFAFKVEHSEDGNTWADLGAFTITGAEIAGESINGTGTVNQYVRFTATRTSGSVVAVCTFARN
jgi:hypothetical protein